MKKLIIGIIAAVILIGAGLGYRAFSQKAEPKFSVAEAKTSDITEKVSVTGSLVPLERINLEPKTQQEVQRVLVKVSDRARKGELLIQLDEKSALLRIDKSQAGLNSVYQGINLLAVQLKNAEQELKEIEQTTAKNIDKTEVALEEAKVNLKTKQQDLEDTKETEDNALEQSYEDALAVLRSVDLQVGNAYRAVRSIQRTYFHEALYNYSFRGDQERVRVRGEEDQIKQSQESIDSVLQTAQETKDKNDIDKALLETRLQLDKVYQSLSEIREICSQTSYYYLVAAADKAILDTQKGKIGTMISDLISAEQGIETQKITGLNNLNSAQAVLDIAQFQLNSAESNLSYVKAQGQQQTTQSQSKIGQLQQEIELKKSTLETSKVDLAQAQSGLEDTKIKAPLAGTITAVNLEQGEIAKPGVVVISMIPEDKYKIEADISEVNIGKIEKGCSAKIEFDAFPDEVYQGQVDKIYPAEIVKAGVVYYRIEVLLDECPDKLKPGFSANLDIIIGQEKNVVTVPYVAVKEDEQGQYVKIVKDDVITETRRVETGLGTDTRIEIKKGLEPGETVVLYEGK